MLIALFIPVMAVVFVIIYTICFYITMTLLIYVNACWFKQIQYLIYSV